MCSQVVRVLVALVFVCAPAMGQTRALPQSDPVPGGVALVPLMASTPEPPVVHFKGRRTMVVRADERWTAVVGIPLATSPGRHTLRIRTRGSAEHTQIFTVRQKRYAEQRIQLKNKRMVNPTKTDLERIGRERKRIKTALKHWSNDLRLEQRFLLPVDGPLSSPFGLRRFFNDQPRKPHSGIDLVAPQGTPVRAPAPGRVVETGHYFFNGKTIFVDHGQGLVTMYCHLDRIDVSPGQEVGRGEMMGAVGKTGRVTGAHLHWGVSLNNTMVEPMLFFPPAVQQQFATSKP